MLGGKGMRGGELMRRAAGKAGGGTLAHPGYLAGPASRADRVAPARVHTLSPPAARTGGHSGIERPGLAIDTGEYPHITAHAQRACLSAPSFLLRADCRLPGATSPQARGYRGAASRGQAVE